MLLVATGEVVLNAVVLPLKLTTHKVRPDNLVRYNSFPSGHTATSFLGAEILRRELKNSPAMLRYSGYFIASAAGLIRLYKNKHWLSDVIAGMMIGILSGKITTEWYEV